MLRDRSKVGNNPLNSQIMVIENRDNTRRASKTLVELSIGIVGIIGVMLAQIASNHAGPEIKQTSYSSTSENVHIVYQFTDNITERVASLNEVSPMATKINLVNILF